MKIDIDLRSFGTCFGDVEVGETFLCCGQLYIKCYLADAPNNTLCYNCFNVSCNTIEALSQTEPVTILKTKIVSA